MVTITPIHRPLRGVQPGEPMQVPAKIARILIVAKRAQIYVEPPKRKRTYQRRDMQAEPIEQVVTPEPKPTEIVRELLEGAED